MSAAERAANWSPIVFLKGLESEEAEQTQIDGELGDHTEREIKREDACFVFVCFFQFSVPGSLSLAALFLLFQTDRQIGI